MIDIVTATPPNANQYDTLAVPFDWILLAAPAIKQAWHDSSNLCEAVRHYQDALTDTYVFALEAALHTAVIHSLFTDARADRDDALPYNATDKRGWVGEAFIPQHDNNTRAYGSKLWLHYYDIATPQVLKAQRFAAQESLGWLIHTGVVDSIDVTARFVNLETSEMVALRIIMGRDGQAEPLYDEVWGATLKNPEGLYAAA